MIRGLVDEWEFVLFAGFDCPITKELYNEALSRIEDAGMRVLVVTCDQGGSNNSLNSRLGITVEEPWSPNPKHPERRVYHTKDWIHVMKNLKNNLMDHKVTLESGIQFEAKKELRHMINHCRSNEISNCPITHFHLDCYGQDRQPVHTMLEVVNPKVVACLRENFPNCPVKNALADTLETFHEGCYSFL